MSGQIWVSGIGIVCPIGSNRKEFLESLLQGKNGFEQITEFNACKGKNYAAKVPGYKSDDPRRTIKMLRRGVKEAIRDAGLTKNMLKNTALVMATMAGDTKQAEEVWGGLKKRGNTSSKREKMNSLIKYPMSSLLDAMAVTFKIEGPRTVVSNACASGNIAIGYGMDLLKANEVDAVIICGIEVLKETMFWGMHGLRILARELKAFDKNRKGTVLGEGVGVLVLERSNNIIARSGKAWGGITGYGNHCDPHSDSIIPNEEGTGLSKAMIKAIADAGITPEDVDYINAYGTGTEVSDLTETRAIKGMFMEKAYDISVSSSKTFLGNSGGASGVLEAIVTLISMKNGFIPPTFNWETRDPELDLDYVPGKGRLGHIRYALSNSIGGGGVNTSIVLESPDQFGKNKVKQLKILENSYSEGSDEIVVTGIGILSTFGNRLDNFKRNIQKLCEDNIYDYEYCPSSGKPEVLEDQFRRANSAARYLLSAAKEATESARIQEFKQEEIGVIIGTAFGGYTTTAKLLCETILNQGPNFITPYVLTNNGQNLGATLLSQKYGISGYSMTITSGSTAGIEALIHAVRILESNKELKVVLAGGVDILDTSLGNAYSYLQEQNGINYSLGEGAGVFVLEKKSSAMKREVNQYGTVTGFKQGSVTVGRGKLPSSLNLLDMEQKRLGTENGRRPDTILCHIPDRLIDKSSLNKQIKLYEDFCDCKRIVDLTGIFGEAHAATGVLGLAYALTESNKSDNEGYQMAKDLFGIFSLAHGGNYSYLEFLKGCI